MKNTIRDQTDLGLNLSSVVTLGKPVVTFDLRSPKVDLANCLEREPGTGGET